jgi:hypothetical protein
LGVRDAARNLDHSVAAERKARGSNPLRVNVTPELGVSNHTADDFAEIASALPPDRKPFHGVRLTAGIARVIHSSCNIAVARERPAEPGHTEPAATGTVRDHYQRKRGRLRRNFCARARASQIEDGQPSYFHWLFYGGRFGRIPDDRV